MMHVPEVFRVKNGPMGSDESYGNNGCFLIWFEGMQYVVIASDGKGWEHVSVSHEKRTPRWEAMCHIKDLFWDETDTVVQYHPQKSEYVNMHEHCLHMWKPVHEKIPVPESILVGYKT